jgi:hypothetical protein
MSEVVETPVAEVKETKKSKSESISMTQESLLELLMKFNEASSDKLANALLESRKPYRDPKQEENEEFMREQAREQRRRESANLKAYQDNCPHLAGSNPLSDQPDLRVAHLGLNRDVWHLHQLPAHLPRDRPGLQPMAAQGDDQQAVPSWRTHIP